MENGFYCQKCGAIIITGKDGREPTYCEHHPKPNKKDDGVSEVERLFGILKVK